MNVLDDVPAFAADLRSRVEQCDNGEGNFCSTLDATLAYYAQLCCELNSVVLHWKDGVFTGHLAMNVADDAALHDVTEWLFLRVSQLTGYSSRQLEKCYQFDNLESLQLGAGRLRELLEPKWRTPKLSTAPGPRNRAELSDEDRQDAQGRLADLPPLPADWQPSDRQQQQMYRKLKPA